MNLSDKVVIVTGAANGIGRASALSFAEKGAHVVLADVDADGLALTAQSVGAVGPPALTVLCDVAKDDDIDELIDGSLAWRGHVDVLMNNAAVAVGGRWESIPIAEWSRVLDVNVLGPARATLGVLPHFLERGDGWIVNIASGAGVVVQDGLAGPYVTSKSALVGMSQALAIYLRPLGIGVTLVCPGLTDTAFPRHSVVWGRRGRHTVGDRDFSGADNPARVAEVIVDALQHERSFASPIPELQDMMLEYASDPEGHIVRHSGTRVVSTTTPAHKG